MSVPILDAAMVLQAATTKTASFNGDALDLGIGYSPRTLGEIVAGSVNVTALDLTSENETYAFKLQESADNSAWADCGVPVSATATGVVLVKGIVTKRYIRLVLTAGGTTPSITYSALAGR